MPTYNRLTDAGGYVDARLVEEAIHSYAIQDYPNRKLLILNDTPGQILRLQPEYCEQFNIEIVNFDERQPTLGDKCNAGIAMCDTDFVCRWDDDDISLSHRLSACANQVVKHGLDVLQVTGYFMDLGTRWAICEGNYGFQQDWYATYLAKEVQYRPMSSGEDQKMRSDCFGAANNAGHYAPAMRDFHYIYRWGGTGSYHASGSLEDTEATYRQIGKRPIAKLDYLLNPHWAQDYAAIAQERIHAETNADSDD